MDLSNWMRDLLPVIGNATVLDLSLPGAHDLLTFDLSTSVSDGAEDIPDWLSDILHDFGDALDFGSFIRNQVRWVASIVVVVVSRRGVRCRVTNTAVRVCMCMHFSLSRFCAGTGRVSLRCVRGSGVEPTCQHDGTLAAMLTLCCRCRRQGIDVAAMLDGGVRFLDLRVMYSRGPGNDSAADEDWYGLHLMQTNDVAVTYLRTVRQWMDAHPGEIVVMWFSKHGTWREVCLLGAAVHL